MKDTTNITGLNGPVVSLRQWYAGMALQSAYKQVVDYCERQGSYPSDWMNGVAADAFRIADAMLQHEAKEAR